MTPSWPASHPAPTRHPAARRARVAVATLFFANGAVFANLVPRYPEVKAELGLSNAAFGTAIAAYGLGALVLGLFGGLLVGRWGSARVAPVSTVVMAANLVLLGVAPSWPALAAALFVAGSLDSVADVGVNAHGLRVERLYRRSVLNSMHGVWSVGAVTGGGMGTAAAGLGLPLEVHLSIAAGVFAVVAVAASRHLLHGPDSDDRPRTSTGGRRLGARHLRIAGSVLALGMIAAMAQVVEDTGATWGAVYLRGELGASAVVGGLGFIALQVTQTIGRLVGDRVVTRFGDRAVARAGAAVGGAAMAAALAFPGPVVTVLAFAAVGLGIGTLIPASMRTADAIPGLAPGVGLTMAGSVLRVAILAAPPLIGLVADASSLRVGLLVVPLAASVVVVLSRALPRTHPGRTVA